MFVIATQSRAETTLYVGKHFEVRDHDQPTKYVFNGSTRVARVTGSLSTNTRIQRFRLHPGWNLLSLAVNATNLSDQLQSPGVVASAHAWNAQTGGYFPVPQVASSGTVLWVNATTNATLSVVGAYSDPVNREVSAGATYLSGTGLEAWIPNFPATLSVWHFSPQPVDSAPAPFGPWRSRLTGNLSAVNDLPQAFPPGRALYVINPAPFELEIPDPALRIRYYHHDHLGSSSVMTAADGVLVEESAFYPFGIPRHEHRLRQVEEHYKFTQKERDRESGLHHFEARYLAGAVSRFLSVDPMYANTDSSAGDPQAMNLYAYVRNNPLQYTDPTGLQPDLAQIADLALRQEDDEGWIGTSMDIMDVGATITTGFCDNAFGCGMGGYQVMRPIIVQGYNVDEDSKLFKGAAVAGFLTSLAVPVPPIASLAGKGGTVGRVAVGGGEAANVAKSVVDPLAKTQIGGPFAKTLPGPASKRAVTVGESTSGAAGKEQVIQRISPQTEWYQGMANQTRAGREAMWPHQTMLQRSQSLSVIDDFAKTLFQGTK